MTTLELTIQGKRIKLSGPSAWNELTPRQAVVLMRFRERVNDEHVLIFPVLELLYGLKINQQKWLFDADFLRRKRLPAHQIERALLYGQAVIDTLRWIGTTEPESTFLVPGFRLYDFQYGSAQVLAQRALHQTVYYTPSEGLANCSFGEFIYADQAYRQTNWPKLAAVLCRPGSEKPTPEDGRESFEPGNYAARTALFAALDPALLSLIRAHFEASLLELKRYFPLIFEEPNPAESTAKSTPSVGWHKIAIGMAKLDATKVPEIEQVNLYLALEVLSEQIRQADELEEQMNNLRK